MTRPDSIIDATDHAGTSTRRSIPSLDFAMNTGSTDSKLNSKEQDSESDEDDESDDDDDDWRYDK